MSAQGRPRGLGAGGGREPRDSAGRVSHSPLRQTGWPRGTARALSWNGVAEIVGLDQGGAGTARRPPLPSLRSLRSHLGLFRPWPPALAGGGGRGLTAELGVALPNRHAARHVVSPEAGDGEFQALLDIWFPEKQPLPTAFLVDTSEEALLLPDWLKLRMIRSEVPRLVDAGTGGPAGPGGLSPGWPGPPLWRAGEKALASKARGVHHSAGAHGAPGVAGAVLGFGAGATLPLAASPSQSGGEAKASLEAGGARGQRESGPGVSRGAGRAGFSALALEGCGGWAACQRLFPDEATDEASAASGRERQAGGGQPGRRFSV